MARPDEAATLAALDRLATALAQVTDQRAFFDTVAATANTVIGHQLFTVMAFDEPAMQVERLYSNRPDAYPDGGRKKKRDTAWGQQVLEQGRPFIGSNANDIRAHFNDHELILSLGLESVLNMPIRIADQTIGTMNLLHRANFYSKADISAAQLIAGLIAPRLAAPH